MPTLSAHHLHSVIPTLRSRTHYRSQAGLDCSARHQATSFRRGNRPHSPYHGPSTSHTVTSRTAAIPVEHLTPHTLTAHTGRLQDCGPCPFPTRPPRGLVLLKLHTAFWCRTFSSGV